MPGSSCSITLVGSAAEGPTSVTIAGSNTNPRATSVTVQPNAFTVGGTISGLVGSLTLQNNGSDPLTRMGVLLFPHRSRRAALIA
jgi:hypothetical protein